MIHHLLSYKQSQISYYQLGTGDEVIFCFHGYGEDGKAFSFLEKKLGDTHCCFAIDLPFHGKTDWKEEEDFIPEDLLSIIKLIFEQNNKLQTTNYKLIGFSLGGRVALSLFQQEPKPIRKVVLLAPDGLKVNFWYWLSTQTWIGNKFFAFTMKKPSWFFGFLKLLNKLQFVNASIFKFVNFYIGDKNARDLLYNRWIKLRKIKPDISIIKKVVKQNTVSFRLIYGKHDRIILPVVGEKFKKGIEDKCTIDVIASGHQVLHEKHTEEIVAALLH